MLHNIVLRGVECCMIEIFAFCEMIVLVYSSFLILDEDLNLRNYKVLEFEGIIVDEDEDLVYFSLLQSRLFMTVG